MAESEKGCHPALKKIITLELSQNPGRRGQFDILRLQVVSALGRGSSVEGQAPGQAQLRSQILPRVTSKSLCGALGIDSIAHTSSYWSQLGHLCHRR